MKEIKIVCKKCKAEKGVNEMKKDPRCKNGVEKICRDCEIIKKKNRYAKKINDMKVGVVPEDLFDLFDITIFGCLKEHLLHLFQMVVKRKRKKNRRSQSKTNRVINHSQVNFSFTKRRTSHEQQRWTCAHWANQLERDVRLFTSFLPTP